MRIAASAGQVKQGIRTIAPIIGAASGIGAFYTKLTEKDALVFANPDLRLWALLGKLGVPRSVLNMISPFKTFEFPQLTLNPIGFLNQGTYTGAAMLAFDYVATALGAGKWGYSWIKPLIVAVGGGMLIGNAMGGILDPPDNGPSQAYINSLPSSNEVNPNQLRMTV